MRSSPNTKKAKQNKRI
nr:hypothetical protein [Staphylococcus aureus]